MSSRAPARPCGPPRAPPPGGRPRPRRERHVPEWGGHSDQREPEATAGDASQRPAGPPARSFPRKRRAAVAWNRPKWRHRGPWGAAHTGPRGRGAAGAGGRARPTRGSAPRRPREGLRLIFAERGCFYVSVTCVAVLIDPSICSFIHSTSGSSLGALSARGRHSLTGRVASSGDLESGRGWTRWPGPAPGGLDAEAGRGPSGSRGCGRRLPGLDPVGVRPAAC